MVIIKSGINKKKKKKKKDRKDLFLKNRNARLGLRQMKNVTKS